MNSRQAYIKLAQTRLAINYVLRTRAMQKQAAGISDWFRDTFSTTNGAEGLSTPKWTKEMGGTLDDFRKAERYTTPENARRSYFWIPGFQDTQDLKEVQDKIKRTQSRRKYPPTEK